MFYSYSILAAKIASMFNEGMACPLEARGRGPIECSINCVHYVSVVKELVLWSCQLHV